MPSTPSNWRRYCFDVNLVVLDRRISAHAFFGRPTFLVRNDLGWNPTQEALGVGILVNLVPCRDRRGQGPLTLHGEIMPGLASFGRALIQGKSLPFGIGVGDRHCGAPL